MNYRKKFLFQKEDKFWVVSSGHKVEHKPLISEEWNGTEDIIIINEIP